ncbi:unnamed protein product [Microthlaspi erraticum]|uniref:Uncharacterized protein n=1 Tax=Microthlaspi erraticum TaxID=1685480 RepID=A0A6D2LAF4_9BRAS|nr:unnamed protein product [Microthlaspi erraticum]
MNIINTAKTLVPLQVGRTRLSGESARRRWKELIRCELTRSRGSQNETVLPKQRKLLTAATNYLREKLEVNESAGESSDGLLTKMRWIWPKIKHQHHVERRTHVQ